MDNRKYYNTFIKEYWESQKEFCPWKARD